MNYPIIPYRIFPLGDSALTADFDHAGDKPVTREILNRVHYLRRNPLPGQVDIIPAYSSFTLYYQPMNISVNRQAGETAFGIMKKWVEEFLLQPVAEDEIKGKRVRFPVCYHAELAPEISHLARQAGITGEELVRLHSERVYDVYMLGFLPGFAYMGPVHEKINYPRKTNPEPVAAGSVGIAGNQTGIYPFASPGGWNIIGRTPALLFDKGNENPVLLQAGDEVEFYPVSLEEFYQLKNDYRAL